MKSSPFPIHAKPDWEGFLRCIARRGRPDRVHFIELFLDKEVQTAICERFDLLGGLDPRDAYYALKPQIRLQRFLGYDYVHCSIDALEMPLKCMPIEDTAGLPRRGGRDYMEEHEGTITNWEEFDTYPRPDPEAESTHSLEW